MINKFGTKRRSGALMIDSLIAVVILIAAAIPAAFVIHYAYSTTVSSAEISGKFNTFGDGVDELIWDNIFAMNDDPSSYSGSRIGDHLNPDSRLTIVNLNPDRKFTIDHPAITGTGGVTIPIPVRVVQIKDTLKAEARDRNVPIAVYMIEHE